jgi:limonene 1,2-monooxygenase
MPDSLRFGVFYAPFHHLDENPTLFYQRDRELWALFDRLGFDELWIGEHHSGGYEMIASPEVMVAAAGELTRRIRIGTGVKSLAFHNPFLVTQTMVQLDHMLRGRAMFGVGPGALAMDAWQIGLDPAGTRPIMDAALDVVMRLLAGERVTVETPWFHLRDAKLHLDPYTKPHMEMAVTSIRSPAGAMAAGRHGLGLMSLGGATEMALATYRKNWGICEEVAARHGKAVDRRNFRVTIQMHLAPTREQAHEEVRFGLPRHLGYMRDVLTVPRMPPEAADDPAAFLVKTGAAVIGTPDDAVACIERVTQGTGGFGVVLLMAHDWADWAATQRSYEMFARYVVPRFNGQLVARQASYDMNTRRRDGFLAEAEKGVADAEGRYEKAKKAPAEA